MDAEQRVEQLEKLLAQEKKKNTVIIKEGNKKNISVYGLGQRFPITLYATGWMILIDNIELVKDFLRENHSNLDWKDFGDPFDDGDPFSD